MFRLIITWASEISEFPDYNQTQIPSKCYLTKKTRIQKNAFQQGTCLWKGGLVLQFMGVINFKKIKQILLPPQTQKQMSWTGFHLAQINKESLKDSRQQS